MTNMESTGAASTESTEREDFAKVEARMDEIKGMNMGDMSDDDLENVVAERKALRAQKEEMMGIAQVEAAAENQERSDAEKVAEVAKAEAEANAQAEKAKQIEERKQADAIQIEALSAEIKEGSIEKQQAENISEKLNEVTSSLMSLFESAGYRSFDDKVSGVEKSVGELPEGDQEKLAEKFFEQTIGRSIGNIPRANKVYLEIGGAFHKRFKELEDTRLKSAGYSAGLTI